MMVTQMRHETTSILLGQDRGRSAFALSIVVVIATAVHFWPFENVRAWQLTGVINSVVCVWLVLLGRRIAMARSLQPLRSHLPHVSLLAFLAVCVLSMASAPDTGRAGRSIVKIVLAIIGGYALFSHAVLDERRLDRLVLVAGCALSACVGYCLFSRWAIGQDGFGFFGSAYKYGTYVAMLTPLCAGRMLMSTRMAGKVWGGGMVLGSVLSAGTLGCVVAIVAGMIGIAIFTKRVLVRRMVLSACAVSAVLMSLLWQTGAMATLRRDVAVRESDGANCRQRYI